MQVQNGHNKARIFFDHSQLTKLIDDNGMSHAAAARQVGVPQYVVKYAYEHEKNIDWQPNPKLQKAMKRHMATRAKAKGRRPVKRKARASHSADIVKLNKAVQMANGDLSHKIEVTVARLQKLLRKADCVEAAINVREGTLTMTCHRTETLRLG